MSRPTRMRSLGSVELTLKGRFVLSRTCCAEWKSIKRHQWKKFEILCPGTGRSKTFQKKDRPPYRYKFFYLSSMGGSVNYFLKFFVSIIFYLF
jgi:hypothetical protein